MRTNRRQFTNFDLTSTAGAVEAITGFCGGGCRGVDRRFIDLRDIPPPIHRQIRKLVCQFIFVAKIVRDRAFVKLMHQILRFLVKQLSYPGCFTRYSPRICLMISSLSPRIWTFFAPSFWACSSAVIRARYSATLFVARPMNLPRVINVVPSAARNTTPMPAGPGLPRDPPSNSTKDYFVRPWACGCTIGQHDDHIFRADLRGERH